MKKFLIIFAVLASLSLLAQADATRGQDYLEETIASNSTHTTKKITLGLPQYVLNNGQYVDNFLVTNSTHIKSVNAKDPIIFKKSDCTFVKYTDATFSTKLADYYSTMAIKPSGQNWSVYDPLQLACTYNTFTNSTGQYLTVQRVHNKGTFDATYGKLKDNGFKSYLTFTNGPSPTGFQNTKVSFVEVLGNITTSSIKIDRLEKFNQLNIGQQIIFTKNNMTQSIITLGERFNIDLGQDYDDLLAVRLTKTSATTLDMEIAFGATAQNLAYNQKIQTDPTYSYTVGTDFRAYLDTAINTDCSQGGAGYDGSPLIELSDADLSDRCQGTIVEWDVSTIGTGKVITNINVRYDTTLTTSSVNCVFSKIDSSTRPSTRPNNAVNSLAVWHEINNSTEYTTATCTSDQTNTVVALGDTAETDLQTLLNTGQTWYALGMRFDPSTRLASGTITTTPANIELEVTYTLPSQYIRFLENDGTTAVASASIIQANATRPTSSQTTTKTTNSTGWAGPFTGLSGNQNFTAKQTNYIVNKTINTNATSNFSISSRIYDVTGCDSTLSNLMTNDTDRTYLASVPLAPTCAADVLTYNYFFKTLGIGASPSNQTTTVRLQVSSTYAQDQTLYVNGTAVSMTYSGGVLTSSAIQVGTGSQNVILKFRLPFTEIVPQPPINPNVKINGTTGTYQVKTLTIKWTPNNATWTSGYRIYNSTDNTTYGLLVSSLANGTTFYNHNINEHQKLMYYRIYSEPYSAGSPASTTVYNRTATFSTAPTGLTITNPASLQLRLSWTIPSSNGNSTLKDCSIRYDNTTAGDVAGWVTQVSNSTISGTCTNRQYTQSSLNAGTSYTYQVREGNSIGFSAWSSNATGTVTAYTDITIQLYVNKTGDAMTVVPRVTYNSGHTGSAIPTLQSIRFYNASSGTIINQTTLNKIFSASSPAHNYTRMYEDMLGMQGSNYNIVVQVTNYSASGTISTTENATLSNFRANYRTLYQVAETESEGTYNYTASRNAAQNRLSLAVNRDTDTTFWNLECQFIDQIFDDGSWVNKSSIIAYNITTTISNRNNVVVKCWNDNPVFTFISYSSTNGTLVVTQYTEGLGNWFGVPLPFLFVIFVAAFITGKNTPIGLLILAGTIGTMGAMGFWADSTGNPLITAAIWGTVIMLTTLGIFVGKRSPY